MDNWTVSEISTANFGDKRLTARFGNILNAFSKNPDKSIPNICKSWCETKGAYRFFSNNKVCAEKIIQPHASATINRLKDNNVILLVQDTTEIDFSSQPTIENLGQIGEKKHNKRHGFYLHPTIAVTPEKLCLGVIDINIWKRDNFITGTNTEKRQRPIEDKESNKWLKSLHKSKELAKTMPSTDFINISDRESDIYEYFAELDNSVPNAHVIVRSVQNRKLNNSDKKLWDRAKEEPAIAAIEFELPAGRNQQQARLVQQEIRAVCVELKAPYYYRDKSHRIKLYAVLATEVSAPNGIKPIEWLLLTSIEVTKAEIALQVLKYYLCRWQIEQYFKILKSGCTIENKQLKEYDRLKACLAIYMIVAWRILYITMIGRIIPDELCSKIFDDVEWQATYQIIYKKKAPKQAPTVYEMVRMIARLGGFLDRKSDKEPGIRAIWIGLQRMTDFTIAWEIFRTMQQM